MSAHSVVGASSAYRWLACPGSVRMCQAVPRRTSKFAEEGTDAHALAEYCLNHGATPEAMIGEDIPGRTAIVTEDMATNVAIYLDAIDQDVIRHTGASYAAKGLKGLRVERRFNLEWLHPSLFGTKDADYIPGGSIAYLYDLKYGAGKYVEVEDNVQLKYYALDTVYKTDVKEVELVIGQPRYKRAEPIRRWRISAKELLKWGREVLVPGANAALDPKAPLNAGDHCDFCDAAAVCPALRNRALTVTQAAFETAEIMGEEPTLPAPNMLTEEQQLHVLKYGPMVKDFIDSVYAHIEGKLLSGKHVPGYKIVKTLGNRKWRDEKAVEAALETLSLDFPEIQFRKSSILPLTKIEKLGPDYAKLVEDNVTRPESLSMVPESDKRPAVNTLEETRAAFDDEGNTTKEGA